MSEYIIVGNTEEYKDCLVCLCGVSLERAKGILHRMIKNPTDNDKALSKGHTNLRIKEVPEEDC